MASVAAPENPDLAQTLGPGDPSPPPGPTVPATLPPAEAVIRPRPSTSHSIRLTATIRTQPANQTQTEPTNNNNGEVPQQTQNLFQMRDRLFLALFFRASLIYARAVPKVVRRILEFLLLMQSLILLFTLAYIHIVYTQTPITCLREYKDSWPKDGVLRVDITTEPPSEYTLAKSYEKEERLRLRNAQSQMGQYSNDDLLSVMLAADSLILDKAVSAAGAFINSFTSSPSPPTETTETDAPTVKADYSVSSSDSPDPEAEELKPMFLAVIDSAVGESQGDVSKESDKTVVSPSEPDLENDLEDSVDETEAGSDGVLAPGVGEVTEDSLVDEDEDAIKDSVPSIVHTASGEGMEEPGDLGDVNGPALPYFNMSAEEIDALKLDVKKKQDILKSSVPDFEVMSNSDHAYIVEYSFEFGFLRLTSETRERLNISVKLITLDPHSHSCFGNNLSRFLLENFLGYDDILMSSVKNLAETAENKGYLRNVVTGEQFRFVSMSMARSAYLPALFIMLVFTVCISMLLRYSHHQIFVFIVDLLNNVEGNGAIHVPAAPLFTVILALVGMEAIMSEFFNDTSTAFYVILIVWIADQYDSVCCHTNVTRTYWVRFFYLYHFVFYAYHYRFNGQYGGLALLTSWSFIQHSMVYFYHHYELPGILRQAHQGEEQRGPPPTPRPYNSAAGGSNQTPSGLLSLPNVSVDGSRFVGIATRAAIATASEQNPRRLEPAMLHARSSSPGRYNVTTVSAQLTITSTRNGGGSQTEAPSRPQPPPIITEPPTPPEGDEWPTNPMESSGLRLRSPPTTLEEGTTISSTESPTTEDQMAASIRDELD